METWEIEKGILLYTVEGMFSEEHLGMSLEDYVDSLGKQISSKNKWVAKYLVELMQKGFAPEKEDDTVKSNQPEKTPEEKYLAFRNFDLKSELEASIAKFGTEGNAAQKIGGTILKEALQLTGMTPALLNIGELYNKLRIQIYTVVDPEARKLEELAEGYQEPRKLVEENIRNTMPIEEMGNYSTWYRSVATSFEEIVREASIVINKVYGAASKIPGAVNKLIDFGKESIQKKLEQEGKSLGLMNLIPFDKISKDTDWENLDKDLNYVATQLSSNFKKFEFALMKEKYT